jgi:predicted amidophosphoribosyltransferase
VAPPQSLRFVRTVDDQGGLSADRRATNLRGAMRAQSVAGRTCLLVDDIVTSGATLAESARALWAGGAREVQAVTLAGAVLRRSPG